MITKYLNIEVLKILSGWSAIFSLAIVIGMSIVSPDFFDPEFIRLFYIGNMATFVASSANFMACHNGFTVFRREAAIVGVLYYMTAIPFFGMFLVLVNNPISFSLSVIGHMPVYCWLIESASKYNQSRCKKK